MSKHSKVSRAQSDKPWKDVESDAHKYTRAKSHIGRSKVLAIQFFNTFETILAVLSKHFAAPCKEEVWSKITLHNKDNLIFVITSRFVSTTTIYSVFSCCWTWNWFHRVSQMESFLTFSERKSQNAEVKGVVGWSCLGLSGRVRIESFRPPVLSCNSTLKCLFCFTVSVLHIKNYLVNIRRTLWLALGNYNVITYCIKISYEIQYFNSCAVGTKVLQIKPLSLWIQSFVLCEYLRFSPETGVIYRSTAILRAL